MNSLINIMNLKIKNKDETIIKNLSFDLKENNVLSILGPSGIGKSSILKAIINLINYEGIIKKSSEEISYLPQELALFENKTVYKNVILPLKIKNMKIDETYVLEILEDLKINTLKSNKIYKLSGGQKQRVAIARSLVLKYKILLLDEPFSGLDEILKKDILNLLLRLKNKYKLSIIYITHDIDECLTISDDILIISNYKKHKIIKNKNLNKEDILIQYLK